MKPLWTPSAERAAGTELARFLRLTYAIGPSVGVELARMISAEESSRR